MENSQSQQASTWTAPHGTANSYLAVTAHWFNPESMARDLLTVQASTVASESAFSISGRIISERRSRLTPESVEVCVCLKDYLDGVDRVQHETSLEGPILEDVEETIAREEVELGISPPNTELDEGEFEDLDIEHVDVEEFLEDLMD
ncbi:zinc finger BED domain-containing protein RICESLEEPER 2 [Tanacetum coccineum]